MGLAIVLLCILPLQAFCSSLLSDSLFVEDYAFGSFEHATRLAISPQGWCYIIDERENSVCLFHDLQKPPSKIGGFGWASSAFDRPTGLATDGLNLFVADYGNHRVQRFDRNLSYVNSLSTRDTIESNARFGYPAGVSLSKSGDLFILDGENLRVVRFSRDGRFLQTFGGIDAERGKLRKPLKVVVSREDRVFVAEPDRIVEFDYFGNYLRAFGEGSVEDLRACDIFGDAVVAVSRDTLWWFGQDGTLAFKKSFKELSTSMPMRDVQDVIVEQNRLFILDARRAFVFSLLFK